MYIIFNLARNMSAAADKYRYGITVIGLCRYTMSARVQFLNLNLSTYTLPILMVSCLIQSAHRYLHNAISLVLIYLCIKSKYHV